MLLKEISQILTTIGNIYVIQEEKILTTLRNTLVLQEPIADKKSHGQHKEEYLEGTKYPRNALNEEIEELLLCTSPDLIYSQETNDQVNMEKDQKSYEYIEKWLQTIIRLEKHVILQHILAPH